MQSLETIEDALAVATQVLEGSIPPNRGCYMIAAVGENLGHPEDLSMFMLIAHEQSGHEHLGITAENCVPDILAACRELLARRA